MIFYALLLSLRFTDRLQTESKGVGSRAYYIVYYYYYSILCCTTTILYAVQYTIQQRITATCSTLWLFIQPHCTTAVSTHYGSSGVVCGTMRCCPVFILLVVNILHRITVWLYHYPHNIVTTGRWLIGYRKV